ncbi:fimbrial protein [Paraburkholderia strydomiana]|jgi:major type 1 subunit fimbrin (pilin)|uniref:fimbrial protein n=1 Tax=Paraburkholderia strydomiana TaxID=1245417 RepID=UPI0038B800BF
MKITRSGVLATALAAAFTMPAVSHAADGTITFTGQITSQTCTISGNGGGKNFTVTLPTVSTSALATAGTTAGRTPFNIALSNCTPNSGNVSTYFEPGATVDTTTGQLVNASGTATNVEVGLLNGDSSAITLGAAQASQNSKAVALASGAATLKYFAQYVATNGASTAGTVNTTVMYSIVYQ